MADAGDVDAVPKVTLTERRSLELTYNLSDAQNYVSLTAEQKIIIDGLGDLFERARADSYQDARERFVSTALSHLGQAAGMGASNRSLPCYSATIGLEIAATYLRTERRDSRPVGLIHPTFDTLAYISGRHTLPVLPVHEQELADIDRLFAAQDFAALILTLPNNPTGTQIDRDAFAQLSERCAAANTVLVIDCCYRYYSCDPFDYYELLHAAGTDYLLVEDTGKLFPLLDIKLGILNCNDRLFRIINSIHSDFLLEVSKFSLNLITSFFDADSAEAKNAYLKLIDSNRGRLVRAMEQVGSLPVGGTNINVQLMRLPEGVRATALQERLVDEQVGIIDATRLYWADPELGSRHIRVALSRDTEYLDQGVALICSALTH